MPTTDKRRRFTCHEGRLTLKDGMEVFIRPIQSTDNDLIIDLFNRISPRSRYKRFLGNMPALPEDMLHQFTHVDYKTGFALVALIEENGIQTIIAVGRYMHDPLEDNTDLALAVRDDWQNLGLGKALLTRIITIAKENGISRFTSMMDTRNTIMEKILRDLGYEVKYFLKSGSYQVEVLV